MDFLDRVEKHWVGRDGFFRHVVGLVLSDPARRLGRMQNGEFAIHDEFFIYPVKGQVQFFMGVRKAVRHQYAFSAVLLSAA